MTTAIVAACVVAVVALLVFRAVFVVPQGQAVVIERLGRFRRVAPAGVRLRVPLLDRARARVDLREQVITAPVTDVVTSGNLMSWVSMRAAVRIVDPVAAVYAHANWASALELLARAELTRRLGEVPWPRALPAHEGIGEAVHTVLRGRSGRWGVEVDAVELTVDSRVLGPVTSLSPRGPVAWP